MAKRNCCAHRIFRVAARGAEKITGTTRAARCAVQGLKILSSRVAETTRDLAFDDAPHKLTLRAASACVGFPHFVGMTSRVSVRRHLRSTPQSGILSSGFDDREKATH